MSSVPRLERFFPMLGDGGTLLRRGGAPETQSGVDERVGRAMCDFDRVLISIGGESSEESSESSGAGL